MKQLLFLFFPLFANAHILNEKFGDFYAGVLHPLTAPEHILTMIALSLLIIQQRKDLHNAQKPLILFWIMIAIGAISAMVIKLPLIEFFNLFSATIFGILVALNRDFNIKILHTIILFFGFTHGYANGEVITDKIIFYYYLFGVLIAISIFMLYFAGITNFLLTKKYKWSKIAIRVAGSWIAAIGMIAIAINNG